jgi:hypothetical protein
MIYKIPSQQLRVKPTNLPQYRAVLPAGFLDHQQSTNHKPRFNAFVSPQNHKPQKDHQRGEFRLVNFRLKSSPRKIQKLE